MTILRYQEDLDYTENGTKNKYDCIQNRRF